jgi:hypothetical protein
MTRWELWVRVTPSQTAKTVVYARNGIEAKLLGEAQYGKGNVLSHIKTCD